MERFDCRFLEGFPVGLAIFACLIVLFRHLITFAGSWILTFSSPKLFLLALGFFALFSFLILIGAKKWKIVLTVIVSLVGIYSASSDFYGLRSDGNYGKNGNSYRYRNNPYLGSSKRLRQLIKTSSDPNDFWRHVCNEFSGLCSESASIEIRAEHAMLLVSNLFYYGNSPLGKDEQKVGCVGRSSETGNAYIKPNWTLYQDSQIGCCNDFAYFLASFLNYLNIKNEFVYMPGHIANRFIDDQGEWVYLDSNTTIMVKGLFRGEGSDRLRFSIYPHPNVDPSLREHARYSMYNFQRGLVSNMSARVHYVMNYLSTQNSRDVDNILKGI